MSEEQKKAQDDLEEEEDGGINLFDYLIVLAKWKKLILGITLSVAVLTAVPTLFVKNTYWGRTTILMPQQASAPMWLRILNDFSGGGSVSSSEVNDPQLFIQLLYTGPVLDKIIDKFGLAKKYKDAETTKEIRETLSSSVAVEYVLPEGSGKSMGIQTSRLLMISVKDKDQAKAADMANAFVEALQDVINEIAITGASQKRLFFEKQLKQTREDLIQSEEAMKEFQEKTGVFKVEQQVSAVIEGIARMRAEIAAKEVELSVMKSYSTPNNPDLMRVAETIKGLKAELSKLEQKGGSTPDPIITTGRMASVGTDYIRKMRDLKFNETLYELMMKQYEMARLEEAGNPTLIQVIEKAYPSEERAGPQRKKKILTSTAIGLFFSILLAFILEFIERQKAMSAENRERVETLKKYLSFKRQR